MSSLKRSTKDAQIELLQLIDAFTNELIDNLNPIDPKRHGYGIEPALRWVDAIDDPHTPQWKKVAYMKALGAPSPLMDFIRKLEMGHDEKESLQNFETWSN